MNQFTLPKGKYNIPAQPLISGNRLVLVMQYLGYLPQGKLDERTALDRILKSGYLPNVPDALRDVGLDKIIGMMATAKIIKTESSHRESNMVDIYVEAHAQALLAIKVIIKQE